MIDGLILNKFHANNILRFYITSLDLDCLADFVLATASEVLHSANLSNGVNTKQSSQTTQYVIKRR
jgi:hypothetical protein